MKLKKLLLTVLSFALIATFAIVPMTANAQILRIKLGFSYGENIGPSDYFIDTEVPDTLFITGKGRMYDFEDNHSTYNLENLTFMERNSVIYQDALCTEQKSEKGVQFFNQKNVVIGDGITYIGDFAFGFFNRLEKIYIPDSVTEISDHMIFINGAIHRCKCGTLCNYDPSKITICCSKDSYAYKYAVDNGFKVDTESQAPQPSELPKYYNISIDDDLSVGKVEYSYDINGTLHLSVKFNPGVNMQHMVTVDWQIEGDYESLFLSECQTECYLKPNSDLKIKPIYHNVSKLKGDTNADGKLTAADVLLTRQYIAGQNVEICISNADVSGDKQVTASDVLMVRKKIAGQLLAPWDIFVKE